MTLVHILVFTAFSLLVRCLVPSHWRGWLLLAGSLTAVFWLQTSTPIRNLDFWLPTASIALVLFTWAVVHPEQDPPRQKWLPYLALTGGVILAAGLLRFLPAICCLGPSRPPQLFQILAALAGILLLFLVLYRFSPRRGWVPAGAIVVILVIFAVLKSPSLAVLASSGLRGWQGQSTELAALTDLPWLGFSYVAFRLIHILRDFQAQKLPSSGMGEFSAYALFYPTITAGPIDRLQRFLPDFRKASASGEKPAWTLKTDSEAVEDSVEGGKRLFFGIIKKFVLADSLALISLNNLNATQINTTAWMWVLLYAYSFRLYFDFAGYTDIAIGLGRIVGIKLPENFNQPYLKPNLTAFWNSWHITLAQWFRAYFFNPMTRSLRNRFRQAPTWSIILVAQMSTMIVIGLWHGLTWSFFAWGAWHGTGLFIHNRWTEWRRSHSSGSDAGSPGGRMAGLLGALVTFNFVALGWVWFAMPDPATAMDVLMRLFGR